MKPYTIVIAFLFIFNNYSHSQSMLLPIPGSITPSGPTGYINFFNQGNPQFAEFPAHAFMKYGLQGVAVNPHSEEDLYNAEPSMTEKYLGQHPMFAQTVVQDANGEVVFFIIDNNIYNRFGVAFEDICNASPSYLLNGPVENHANIFGNATIVSQQRTTIDGESINRSMYANNGIMLGSEILVFPISGKCNTYGLAYTFFDTDANSESSEFFFRTIEIIDEHRVDMGLSFSLAKTYNMQDCYLCNNIANRSVGISKMRSNGTYVLFANLQNYVYTFIIDQNGTLSYNNNSFSSQEVFIVNQEIFPSYSHEMEIIEINDINGNPIEYRVAVPINGRKDINSGFAGIYIYSVDYYTLSLLLDANQNPKWVRKNMPQILSLPFIEEIKGLEFSNDGRYLFVTYFGQDHIHYIDLLDNTIHQLSNGIDYQYSGIEMGHDGCIYFLGIDQALSVYKVSRLINPENPSVINWEQNILNNVVNKLFLSYKYDSFLTGPSYTQFAERAPKLNFMGQMSNEDYSSIYTSNWSICCDPYTIQTWPESTLFNQNTVWTWEPGNNPFNNTSGKVTFEGTLEIPDGVKLTIKDMSIEFKDAAKLIVSWGSELILDGASLTGQTPCGSFWQGITVLGKSNEPQTSTNQGKVIMMNQAHIADAIVGVSTGNARSTGGIIQASNSTFRNCLTAIKMYPFHNQGSNNKPSYEKSYFYNCTFVTDDDYLYSN